MIVKKRGQGAGKWNMPGGKQQPGETLPQAAQRECVEETGIHPTHVTQVGTLEFFFAPGSQKNSWDNICGVFVSREFSGTLQPDSDECSAHWVKTSEIPYEKMWEDDRKWLPLLMKGEAFHFQFFFDTQDKLIGEKRL